MLISLKNYIKNHQLVSLSELISKFDIDPDILREMLTLLIKKGIVQLKNKTTYCGSKCVKCNPLTTELYEWVNA